MPKIKVYEPNLELGSPTVTSAATGGLAGAVMQQTGADLENLGERIAKLQTQRDVSKMSANFALAGAELTQQFRDTIAKADPNDPNVAADFVNNVVRPRIEKVGEDANTPEAKLHYQETSAQQLARFTEIANQGQHELTGIAAAQNHLVVQNATTSMLVTAPGQFDAAIEQLASVREGMVKSGLLDRADALRMKAQDNALAAEAAVGGWIDAKKPRKALELLKGGVYDEHIDGVTKARLMRQAESAIQGEDDYTRGLLRLQFQDDMAQLNMTGQTTRPWTEDEARAIAENPVQAEQLATVFKTATAVGSERKAMLETPLADDLKHVSGLIGQLGGVQEFGVESERAQAAQQALEQKARALKDDPVGYTMEASPYVKMTYDKFAQQPTPARFQEFMTMTQAAQRRILGGEVRAVLPKQVIADIGNTMAKIGEDGGAEAAGKKLAEWQAMTGPQWPLATRDLFAAKVLSPAQYVAASVMGSRDITAQPLAADLLKADGLKEDDLAKLAGGGDARTRATQAAVRALAPMRQSLEFSPGGAELYNAQVEALSKLLLYRGAGGGRDRSSQASDLAAKMFLNDYNFRGHMRIPRSADAGAVERGTHRVLKDLSNIVAPVSALGLDDYPERVKANGIWITNSDETGAKLIDDVGRAVLEQPPGAPPRQVERTWQELQMLSPKSAPAPLTSIPPPG